MIHGRQDTLIPPSNSERLYENASQNTKAKLLLLDERDHNNILFDSEIVEPIKHSGFI